MRVFVSYRRGDASAWAGRLGDALAARLDQADIYQDIVTIEPGEDFVASIEAALARCDVVLAVIGPQWSSIADPEGTRRLDDPGDHVRTELSRAMALDKRVIPVLVGGASMPTPDRLPDDLAKLGLLQAVTLNDSTWRRDVDDMMNRLFGPPSTRSRHTTPLVAGVAVVTAVVIGAVAWSMADRGSGGSDDADEGGIPISLELECGSPQSSGWVDLGEDGRGQATIDREGSTGWLVEVRDTYIREDPPARDLMMEIVATNKSPAAMWHYPMFYKLVVDGRRYDPECWSLTGGAGSMLGTDESGQVLVGFAGVTGNLADGFALTIETPEAGRIDLTLPMGW